MTAAAYSRAAAARSHAPFYPRTGQPPFSVAFWAPASRAVRSRGDSARRPHWWGDSARSGGLWRAISLRQRLERSETLCEWPGSAAPGRERLRMCGSTPRARKVDRPTLYNSRSTWANVRNCLLGKPVETARSRYHGAVCGSVCPSGRRNP